MTQHNIVFVLFPNVTQLDFTGPLQVLSRLPGAVVHLASETMAPVQTDTVLTLNPTHRFDNCPQADVLCIPGGFGVDDAICSQPLMTFVTAQAKAASYVTSVCTGAFVLGAAGLLKGKRATTHWAYHEALALVGAHPVRERVVRDGNILTGGGVTAGIDFAFTLVAQIAGNEVARAIQLGLEYDPLPPFNAGSPENADADILYNQKKRYEPQMNTFKKKLKSALSAQ